MAKKRIRRAAAEAPAASPSLVEALDDDLQVQVLHAAKAAKVLAALASSSKQLCCLARSRVPVQLRVTTPAHAELVIRSHASRRPPFSACTELNVVVDTLASCLIAVGVFSAAQQWTALASLDLYINVAVEQLAPNQTLDYCSAGILSALPALKGLQCLILGLPEFGACSAAQIGQLVQLTYLDVIVTQSLAADAAPADMSALSAMTGLVELKLYAPAVQPAAGAAGPFCFPSTLTYLEISDPDDERASPACIPRCLTHLPGCPALQELRIYYSLQQHPSAHPRTLVGLLAQHNRQLRKLDFDLLWGEEVKWDAHVPGLADAADPVAGDWHPDASLAALKGLEHLCGGRWLCLGNQEDWQHMAQLTALTYLEEVRIAGAPALLAGLALSVLELGVCSVQLGGYDMGCVLLACPGLQHAHVCLENTPPAGAVPPGSRRLTAHPSLQSLHLEFYNASWGASAPAHWAALAPVLAGVSRLTLSGWPSNSTSQPLGGLPDLSPCTALTQLEIDFPSYPARRAMIAPEQEDFLAMLAPLVQLQCLEMLYAPRLNARVVLSLQHMLPRLKKVCLFKCGSQLPLEAAAEHQQRQEEIMGKVKRLLRDGLQLVVS